MKIIAVTARYASTRFPAKLMQDHGTVILRTYEAAVHTYLFDDVL
jgi:3-deoxy-manno-octulosonate cytidylyltransferase (CMP-KDO synthetase)